MGLEDKKFQQIEEQLLGPQNGYSVENMEEKKEQQ